MPIVRTAANVAMSTRTVVRDLGRLQEIVRVLGSHGLGWAVAKIEVPDIGLLRRLTPDSTTRESPTPERLAAVFRDLGPTFVKLGQVLSTREDILPGDYVAALQSLQDDVGPFPYEQVVEQIRNGLGDTPETLFERFDPEPIATASIAQVHEAKLTGGERVAIKVQRPGIRSKIQTDLSILEFLARQLELQFPELKVMDLPGVLVVLKGSISDETDFRREADTTDQFRRNFEAMPEVVVPKIYRNYVSAEVLCLEFLEGTKIAEAREAGYDMKIVGERYLRAAFQMLLEDGRFHGDLHPGNVLVLPGERLGLLDFGMAGRLTVEMKENLIEVFFALQRRDYRTIARVYWELAIKPEQVDFAAWENDVQELMERQIAGKAMRDIQLADFLRDLLKRAHRHQVRTSPSYTMFFKALITTEGLAKMLLPEVDPMEEMIPYVRRMIRKQYSTERLREEIFHLLTAFRFTARRLPMVTGQMVSDLQDGRLRLRAVVEPSDEARRDTKRQSDRVVLAIAFCGMSIGASLALSAPGPALLGFPAPAAIGYGLSAVLLWKMWRSGGKKRSP